MKSTLNAKGIYVNCKITEIPKNNNCKIFIKVANCEDGYRCAIGWDWNMWSITKCLTPADEAYSTDKEAIREELNKAMGNIINLHGVQLHAEMLYFMRQILDEYNQLELF